MKKLFVMGIAVAVTTMFAAAALAAGDGGAANRSADKADAPEMMAGDVEMALALADWGRANSSAEALVAAAQILAASKVEATEAEKTTETAEGEAQEKADAEPPAVDAEALLAEAATMAKKQKNLKKHIDGLTLSSRGATGGPKYTVDKVQAYTTDIFVLEYKGAQFAEVAVVGDGDTDLDLYVYDEYGNLIASDADSTDTTYCSWVPAWTGKFRIEVRNLGAVYNQYTLITN